MCEYKEKDEIKNIFILNKNFILVEYRYIKNLHLLKKYIDNEIDGYREEAIKESENFCGIYSENHIFILKDKTVKIKKLNDK